MHPKKMKPPLQTKGKRNERLGKFLTRSGMSRPDLSNLRKPIDTSVSDLHQVCELFEDGTDEVKSILAYECNVIYECRICQSLFRSIVNLVSHKREYCREKFDVTLHRRVFNNYNVHSARESIIHMYKTEQASNDSDGVKNDRILRSQVPKEPNKKDLSEIIDRLNKKRQEYVEKQLENENAISNVPDDRHIYLEPIDTNCSAVYQTIESAGAVVDAIDLMKEQITELQNITDQNSLAVEEQTENQLEKSDSPIQARMSEENDEENDMENKALIYRLSMNNLSCSICSAKFSTRKTLNVHIKTLHTSKRLCYPCPCCTNIFANTWSVYRHLSKVHKKTNEQVRNLRPQIQEKAFQRKTTAMRRKKKDHVAKVSVLKNVMENSDKTQEPISHVESDTKICGRRGRRSSRKTSLSTFLQYCQTPIAACDETTIRIKRNTLSVSTSDIPCETEDVDLVANTIIKSSVDEATPSKSSERTSSSLEISDHDMSIRVQDVASLSKEDWDMLGNERSHLSERSSVDNNNDSDITLLENIDDSKLLPPAENQDNCVSDEDLNSPGTACTNANEVSPAASKMRNKNEEASSHHNEERLTDPKGKDKIKREDNSELQSYLAQPNEKNRTLLMESKIASIADFRKLRCLSCRRKFTSIPNLRRHTAMHVGWNRYRCKLCDFKCFVKCDCVAHCNKMHNMQNDRTAIAEMIFEIPQDDTCNEDVVADATGPKAKSDNPDVAVDVIASSDCQLETRVNSNDSSDSDTSVISQTEGTAANERVAESRESAACEDVDEGECDRDKTAEMQELSRCMINNKKLGNDPELKRFIMQVIFGSTDTNATEAQTDSDKPVLETNDGESGRVDTNGNVNNAAPIKSKEALCPILNNVKHQRPMRNRIRPLNEDFIYDLKEMAYRKESALINDSETLHVRKKAKLYN